MLTRRLAPLLAALLAALCLAALPVASAAPANPKPRSPHVVGAIGKHRHIADPQGRFLLLRGINSNALVQYPDYFQQTVPMSQVDIQEMSALGFNFLRLPVNWSLLEPNPGEFSQSYLAEIRRQVAWAETVGMWVLVDMHQDRYNRNLRPEDEADGAPDWATVTDGKPCVKAFFTSPCSQAAYDNFWNNTVVAGKPLQTHYLEALLTVSRYLRKDSRLLGFELMNEPTFGSTGSPDFERTQLWPFYRRMIAGLRRDGDERMIWFEPSILRDVADVDPGQPERFSNDDNLVYAPHIYTGTFNGGGQEELAKSYAAADAEAKAYGAAWVNGEWGGGSDEKAEAIRESQLNLQDGYRVGGAFWMWKQQPGFYNWGTVQPDGQLRTDTLRAQQLSRPHVDFVPGSLRSTSYSGGQLLTRVWSPGGVARFWSGTQVVNGATSLLPTPYTEVRIDGAPVRPFMTRTSFTAGDTQLDGYRIWVRLPKGEHEVTLSPGPASG